MKKSELMELHCQAVKSLEDTQEVAEKIVEKLYANKKLLEEMCNESFILREHMLDVGEFSEKALDCIRKLEKAREESMKYIIKKGV